MSTSFSLSEPPTSVGIDPGMAERSESKVAQPMAERLAAALPTRPAWVEIDLKQLKRNFERINQDKPSGLKVLAVVKDDGYGHGALSVARVALEQGAGFLALSTLEEAVTLRER